MSASSTDWCHASAARSLLPAPRAPLVCCMCSLRYPVSQVHPKGVGLGYLLGPDGECFDMRTVYGTIHAAQSETPNFMRTHSVVLVLLTLSELTNSQQWVCFEISSPSQW